jgi:16S rRNA (cytosine967-C5)-methyltransferase
VLRNFLRQKDHIMPLDSGDVLKHISITTSHPRWLVKRWLKRFGYEETLMLARKNNEVPPFVIRVNESERADTVNALLDKGLKAVETHYSPAGIRIDTPLSFEDLDKLCPARFIAQDEAAQLVTYLLDPHPGNRVLDACAAPGGKTTHIVGLMGDKGEIIAVETDEKRVQQLKETVSRTGCTSVKIIQADVRDLHKKFGMFDKILLDAPCSSTGVIRRNPDIKYRHALRDLQRLKKMQIDLLTAVASVLKAGGELVYSVCSTEPEEGEEVLKEFLKTFPNFSIIKSHTNLFDAFESVEAGVQGNTAYRMYPHRHDMDGFFAAKLRRIS